MKIVLCNCILIASNLALPSCCVNNINITSDIYYRLNIERITLSGRYQFVPRSIGLPRRRHEVLF